MPFRDSLTVDVNPESIGMIIRQIRTMFSDVSGRRDAGLPGGNDH